MNSRELETAFARAMKERLAPYGFRKHGGNRFTVELDNEVLGTLGLNTVGHHETRSLEVNPIVGVRHQPTERIVAQLFEKKFDPVWPSTASLSIGYVMPQQRYLAWNPTASTIDQTADDLAAKVVDVGLVYMRSHTDIGGVLSQLNRNNGLRLEYTIPVAWAIDGDLARARAAMQRSLDAIDRESGYADRLRAYAANFFAWLETLEPR